MTRSFSNLHVSGALRDMSQRRGRWGRARVLSAEGGGRGGVALCLPETHTEHKIGVNKELGVQWLAEPEW